MPVPAEIHIIKGDITERETDAIINTANNMLILGSGLGGAIKAKGGKRIAEECARYDSLPLGEAIITTAGGLKAKWVIHAVLHNYDSPIEGENISKSLLTSLRLANKRKLSSIAIPDMSVGIVRFSPSEAAVRVFRVLKQFLTNENRALKMIEVVVWDFETLHTYQQAYEEIFK